jgi:hypothetical protein
MLLHDRGGGLQESSEIRWCVVIKKEGRSVLLGELAELETTPQNAESRRMKRCHEPS